MVLIVWSSVCWRALPEAITATAPKHGYKPEPGCEADGELEIEEGLKGKTTWDRPLTDTHSMGGVTLLAATDYARCFGDLFDGQRLPCSATWRWPERRGRRPWRPVG